MPTGCASGPPGWWNDRARDLTDVAHVDLLSDMGFAFANLGPLGVGAIMYEGWSSMERTMLGLGGVKTVETRGGAAGIVLMHTDGRRTDDRVPGYERAEPSWGSVGVDAGLMLGFGAHVDFVEFGDLLAGLFGFDPMGDDLRPTAPE